MVQLGDEPTQRDKNTKNTKKQRQKAKIDKAKQNKKKQKHKNRPRFNGIKSDLMVYWKIGQNWNTVFIRLNLQEKSFVVFGWEGGEILHQTEPLEQ